MPGMVVTTGVEFPVKIAEKDMTLDVALLSGTCSQPVVTG